MKQIIIMSLILSTFSAWGQAPKKDCSAKKLLQREEVKKQIAQNFEAMFEEGKKKLNIILEDQSDFIAESDIADVLKYEISTGETVQGPMVEFGRLLDLQSFSGENVYNAYKSQMDYCFLKADMGQTVVIRLEDGTLWKKYTHFEMFVK